MKHLSLLPILLLTLHTRAQDTGAQDTTRAQAAAQTRAARTGDTLPPHDTTAWDYVMMHHGQLIEVVGKIHKPVTHNIVLVNESTIHPNGLINVSSGRTRHLKEGEYITMDGRIRKLKNMPHKLRAST